MVKKSQSRMARDEAMRERAGLAKGRRFDRNKSSRSWYELKMVHQRSQAYIEKTARLFGQYAIPRVLVQIERNGDRAEWVELQASIPPLMASVGEKFTALWDSHKDIKRLCRSTEDLTAAYSIFEKYQAFDSEFYTTVGGIIEKLNAIFNKALKVCLDADDAARLGQDKPDENPTSELPVSADAPEANLLPAFREIAESLDEAKQADSADASKNEQSTES